MSEKNVIMILNQSGREDLYVCFADADTYGEWLSEEKVQDPAALNPILEDIKNKNYDSEASVQEVRKARHGGDTEFFGEGINWQENRASFLVSVAQPVFWTVQDAMQHAKANGFHVTKKVSCYGG